ncbi:hypothetical protein FRX31_007250 [Thalictrum thalictroides]|uniref:F-box domain-containing protein n=1 Tax=Thalictrum thalictroides TaxID=46969 RepID=A0A7J6X247_THATH|nr:hypothetical protein FRX31_007250 [Thalictrum thalictroides]
MRSNSFEAVEQERKMHTAASSPLFSETLAQDFEDESSKRKWSREAHWDKKMRLVNRDEDEDAQENDSNNNKIVIHEDVIEEIFLRLPLKSLHRCKSLSKTSGCLISSASFLPRYLVTRRIKMSSLMLGFFYQPFVFSGEDTTRPQIKFIPCSSVAEKLMMNEVDHQNACGVLPFDESLSFLLLAETNNNVEYDDIMKGVYIDASSNGFLLCRREPEFGLCYFHYYICNPVTKQWVSLPRPPNNTELRTGIVLKDMIHL